MSDEEKKRIRELEEEVAVLRSLLRTDKLTRVLNRQGIEEEFNALFREAKYSREEREHRRKIDFDDVAVLFFDLDNFKSLNDTYGHDAGDAALRNTASVLARNIRGIDRVGRYGGEEFVVALPGAAEDDAAEKAEALNKKLAAIDLGADLDFTVTASIGVATLATCNAERLQELIDCADKAMYEAKTKRGKNAVVRWSEAEV